LPLPPDTPSKLESENIEQARIRIISVLGIINLTILVIAGAGGYFLAGQTLDPIAKMVDEQKDFVSNASHELRTPLTSLTTEIEVAIRDKTLTLTNAKKLLASNLDDVKRMSKLSNYLLKLHKYEVVAGVKFSDVDLKNVVENAIKGFSSKFELSLQKSIVKGNEDALTELTIILLDNAIKYGKGKKITVKTRIGGILKVTDRGVGIAEDDLPHIFDRFYRSDKSRGTDGYGLGLSIAKSIVNLHKGKIEVESKAGRGTTFTVSL
jgi:signal transduction histidine kinase